MRRTLALVMLCLLAVVPLALAASATVTESYGALLKQIDARQVVIAHVNEQTNDISVTLKNGNDEFVHFRHADHKTLIDSLLHHGVTPIYTKHRTTAKPVHHVLRYIAAGVVVVLLLIGGGVWMYTRGQRQPPGTGPSDAGPGTSSPPGAPQAPAA